MFALDQGFPDPVIAAHREFMPEVDLVSIREIDPRLPDVEDDWRILMFLHQHERPWDGLVTTDSSMAGLPKELAVLLQTKLTLVVAEESGHDPVKASGLVLPGICKRTDPGKAQLWLLRAAQGAGKKPWEQLRSVAERSGADVSETYEAEKLSAQELARPVLG